MYHKSRLKPKYTQHKPVGRTTDALLRRNHLCQKGRTPENILPFSAHPQLPFGDRGGRVHTIGRHVDGQTRGMSATSALSVGSIPASETSPSPESPIYQPFLDAVNLVGGVSIGYPLEGVNQCGCSGCDVVENLATVTIKGKQRKTRTLCPTHTMEFITKEIEPR